MTSYKYEKPKEKGIKIKVSKVQGDVKEEELKVQQEILDIQNEDKDMGTGTEDLDSTEGLTGIHVEVGREVAPGTIKNG